MAYLIDGNNVMGQRVGWHRDKPRARRLLLDDIAGFARNRNAHITVVFDGAPEQHFPDGSSYKGVRVHYAERNSNADERIKKLVDESKERKTLTVVTSDRALGDYVRRCGVTVMRSGEFRKKMEEVAGGSDAFAAEPTPLAEEELPEWMRYFGVAPEDDDA